MTPEEITKLVDQAMSKYDFVTPDGQKEILAEFGKKVHDEVMTKFKEMIAELGKPKEITIQEEKVAQMECGFKGLSEFSYHVGQVHKEGMSYLNKMVDNGDTRLKTLMTSTQGEFTIPQGYANQILAVGLQNNPFFSRATQIPLDGNSVRLPYMVDKTHTSGNLFGGVAMGWTEEAGSIDTSDLKFGMVTLNLHKLAGMIPASSEFIEDAPFAVNTMVRDLFGEALGWYLEDAFINGNGAGKPLGVINSPALISVAKESAQAADTVVYDNITKMWSRIPPRFRSNAIWIYGSDVTPQLLKMKIGDSYAPAFIPAGQMRNSVSVDTLLGRPAFESEHVQALGTTGDILLVDPTQYLVATKRNNAVRFDQSSHLYFATDREALRIVYRVDGQPWWETYITQANSNLPTRSAFVKLDERG